MLHKIKNMSRQLIAAMLITAFAFLLRDGLGMGVPVEFFLVLYFLSFMAVREAELLLLYIFLVPLSVELLLYYVNVLYGLCLVIRRFDSIKINSPLLACLVLVLWETVHSLTGVFMGYDESIVKLLGFSLCIFATSVSISEKNKEYGYINLLFSWCCGFAAFCGILLFKYMYLYGISNYTAVVRRFGWVPDIMQSTSTSLTANPNELGKLVVLTVFCLLTVLKFEMKYGVLIVLSLIYFTSFGILSASRGFALVGTILLLIYFFELFLNIRKEKKSVFVLSFGAVALVMLINRYMSTALDMFYNRLRSPDISGSRFTIYKEYIQALSRSLYVVFGSGMQEYPVKYNMNISSHNLFIEVVCIWGIIGLFFTGLWFFCLYRSIGRRGPLIRRTVLPYLPLLGLFLSGQFGQFFISYYRTFPTLILAFLNLKYACTKNGEERESFTACRSKEEIGYKNIFLNNGNI